MKKRLLNIVFVSLFGLLCLNEAAAQSYAAGLLSHSIIVHGPDYKIVAHVKPTDQLRVDSGSQYYWFAGGKIQVTQGGYSGKLLNGLYEVFYANQNLKESGHFISGLKSGVWKNWTEKGLLQNELSYKSGKLNGTYSRYDTLGLLRERGFYQNDLLHGKHERVVGDSTKLNYYHQGQVKQRKRVIYKFLKKVLPH